MIDLLPTIDFNSIKVRLELDMLIFSFPFRGFQFHKGTIRTAIPLGVAVGVVDFNSIKVRLERPVLVRVHPLDTISIP